MELRQQRRAPGPKSDVRATRESVDNVGAGPEPGAAPPEIVDLRCTPDPLSVVRRVKLGGCLVDLVTEGLVRRIFDGHLGRSPGTGTLLVASANLDHITHFRSHPEGDGLDPGRMDDWLVLLDGMPLVRAAGRLTGTDSVSYTHLRPHET